MHIQSVSTSSWQGYPQTNLCAEDICPDKVSDLLGDQIITVCLRGVEASIMYGYIIPKNPAKNPFHGPHLTLYAGRAVKSKKKKKT